MSQRSSKSLFYPRSLRRFIRTSNESICEYNFSSYHQNIISSYKNNVTKLSVEKYKEVLWTEDNFLFSPMRSSGSEQLSRRQWSNY